MKKYTLILICLLVSSLAYAADDEQERPFNSDLNAVNHEGSITGVVKGWYEGAKDTTGAAYDATKNAAKSVVDGTVEVYDAAKEKTGAAYDATKDVAKDVVDGTKNAASNTVEGTKEAYQATTDTFKKYRCGTKTQCAQMESCEEAQFFVRACGVVSLDPNKTGKPCPKLCK